MDGSSIRGGAQALPVSSLGDSARTERGMRELMNARHGLGTAEDAIRRETLAGADRAARGSGGAAPGEKPEPKQTARALDSPTRAEFEGPPRAGREAPASVKALEHAARRGVVVGRVSAESATQVAIQGDRRGEAEGAKATGPTTGRPATETTRTSAASAPAPPTGRTATLLANAVGGVPKNVGPHIDLLF